MDVARLALVDLLPETIQQQVREGKIGAHSAMKYLVPVARISLEDCERMAAILAQHHCESRQAGQLYTARRNASPAIRKRILDAPDRFFKTRRQSEPRVQSAMGSPELLRDLEMVVAIADWSARRCQRSMLRNAKQWCGRPSRHAISWGVWQTE